MHDLIRVHATDASLLRYQEAIGRCVAEEAAAQADLHARGFSRVAAPVHTTVDDISAALVTLAGILRKSTFPQQVINPSQEGA